MKRLFISLIASLFLALGLSAPAAAQSACPSIVYGAVLTAAQWNACFQAKNDTLGYTPLSTAGGTMSGKLTTAIPTTIAAGFNLPPGAAPTSPVNGDMWTTSSGIFIQVNGATVGPFNSTIFVGPTAPPSPALFTIWINTAASTSVPYNTWDGTSWVPIGTLNTSTHIFSASFPVSVAVKSNLNAASLQTAQTGSVFQGQQVDGTIARNEMDAFGAIAAFTGVISGGTKVSPTAVTSGTALTDFNTFAYNGSAIVGPIASIHTSAAENIASGHQGSKVCLATTPTASTTLTDSLCQQASGGLTVGSPTSGDQGTGTVNATGLYQNGAQVVSGPVSSTTGDVASFADTTGKILADSGTALSNVVTAAGTLTTTHLIVGSSGKAVSALSAAGTVNQVLHGNAAGNVSFSAVDLTADVANTLPVGNGGLGIASGTSGGVPCYTATTTIASSALLGNHGVILGGGAGACVKITATGSAGQLFQSNGSGSDPGYTLSTYPSSSGGVGNVPRSDGTNFVSAPLAIGDISGLGTGVSSLLSGASSGTGGPAGTTNPAFTAPNIGAATATNVNKVTITQPASSAVLTIANGKTLTSSNTLTFTGTDGSSVNVGTGGAMQAATSQTPTLTFTSTGTPPACTYDSQDSYFTTLSNGTTMFAFALGTSNCSSVGTGTLQVTLPITATHASGGGVATGGTWTTFPAGWRINAGSTQLVFQTSAGVNVTVSALNTGTAANRAWISGVIN